MQISKPEQTSLPLEYSLRDQVSHWWSYDMFNLGIHALRKQDLLRAIVSTTHGEEQNVHTEVFCEGERHRDRTA